MKTLVRELYGFRIETEPETRVCAEWFLKNDPELFEAMARSLSDQQHYELMYQWSFWARDKQLPPKDNDWSVWFLHAGRGFGKTRTGAEFVRWKIETGQWRRVALVGEDAADVRDVMVTGESGLLNVCPPWAKPRWIPSTRTLIWPNGAIAKTYSALDPEQLRGPQHDGAWCDEIAKWRYEDAWHQLMFGLRLGAHPQVVVTSTLRPKRWVKKILDASTTRRVGGGTIENSANLSAAALREMFRAYEGTRLGRQELHGEYLDDTPGALWARAMFDRPGFRLAEPPRGLRRVVVAIDPAVSASETSDETGIVVAGRDDRDRYYVLGDFSGRYSPEQWARRAVELYDAFKADCIVGEVNNGGDLVFMAIKTVAEKMYLDGARRSKEVPFSSVHASRGKAVRAQPISMLYEQGRAHHVGPLFDLEDQMVQFTPDGTESLGFSPDRVDALVWGLTEVSNEVGYQGFVM